MQTLKKLLEQNRLWAKKVETEQPGFFEQLAKRQTPEYFWIGCADSRVPANELTGQLPGDVFVHRNVANLVIHTDLNCLSALQYAVDILKVSHIIVTGHYGCGGVASAIDKSSHGLIDNWLRHIRDVYMLHRKTLDTIEDENAKRDRLCELNVIEQVQNVCATTIVQDAWSRGQQLSVHGWIYSLTDGLLRDLGVCTSSHDQIERNYEEAIKKLES